MTITTIMENKFNDNELDRWLRSNAEAQAPDGWDSPSEAVWTGLRSGLDARKKRRRFFLLLWFGLLAGLLGGIGFWQFQPENAGSATETISKQPVAEQKTNVAPTPILTEKSVATPTGADNGDTPQASGFFEKNTTATKQTQSAQTTAQVNTKTLPAAAQATGSSPKTNPQSTDPASGPMAVPAQKIPQELPEQQPGTSPEASENRYGMALETPALLSTLPQAPLSPLPAHQRAYHPEPVLITPVEKTEKPRKAGWYAGAVSGMFFTSRNLQTQTGQALNGTETGSWTWQHGIQLGRNLNAHWALETGLQRSSIRLQAERLILFQYRTDREKFNPNRYLYQNSTDQVIQTSFGAVDMRMDMGREPSRPILDQANVEIMLRTNEQVNFLRIPLLLHYQTGKGPWQWSLGAGLGINLKTGYELSLTAARANRPGVRNISARVQNRPDGLAPVMLDAQFGAGLQYRLAPRWALQLSPQLRYGISSINRSSALKSFAVSGGLQLGLNYNFN